MAAQEVGLWPRVCLERAVRNIGEFDAGACTSARQVMERVQPRIGDEAKALDREGANVTRMRQIGWVAMETRGNARR